MVLEGSRFGELGEAHNVLAFSNAAGVFTARGKLSHEGLEAMDGEAVLSALGLFFTLCGRAGQRLSYGVASQPLNGEFVVLEEHTGKCAPQVPLHVVRQHAQKDVRLDMRFRSMVDRAQTEVYSLQAAECPLHLRKTLVCPHGVFSHAERRGGSLVRIM